jgi:O-succinylbenzoic acid--CoA ligase
VTFSDWPWRHWRQLRGEAPAVRLNDVILSWRQLCAEVDALAADSAQGRNEGQGVRCGL